jgi:hypothetical protein
MPSNVKFWGGAEWQEHVNLLLKRHYGPGQYVEVPDTDGGDCGLEGYSRDGCLYQCFAAEEPCPNDVLNKRQRNKMARDLKKFVTNAHKLGLILGDVKIRRWILMVPHFESRHLIEYAVERTNEIRAMNLPYATADFHVHVETASTFAVEERELVTRGLASVKIEASEIMGEEVTDWLGTNVGQAHDLDTKLQRVPTLRNAGSRKEFRDRLIRHLLEGQNVIEQLHNRYPDQYEQWSRTKQSREGFLESECMITDGSPSELLFSTLGRFKEEIAEQVGGIPSTLLDSIAWEAVADWLIRCPLRFPEANANA